MKKRIKWKKIYYTIIVMCFFVLFTVHMIMLFNRENEQLDKMDKKIEIVQNYLPKFLVENRSLYSILSKGVHELDEEECLQYFESVKIGIEQILDEKIIQKEKVEKAAKARKAIQKVHRELASK